MSSRPFDFSHKTKKDVCSKRQKNICALCGKLVTNIPITEAQIENGQVKGHTTLHFHHIWPNQMGNLSLKADQWIKSDLNCVMLCPPCHEQSHEDANYSTGAVLHPTAFIHSHGKDMKGHKKWADELKKKIGY